MYEEASEPIPPPWLDRVEHGPRSEQRAPRPVEAVPDPPPTRQVPAPSAAAGPEQVGRHCLVVDAPALPGTWPGLLVEWRQRPDGAWEGRVVVAYRYPGGSPCVLDMWLSRRFLRQVT